MGAPSAPQRPTYDDIVDPNYGKFGRAIPNRRVLKASGLVHEYRGILWGIYVTPTINLSGVATMYFGHDTSAADNFPIQVQNNWTNVIEPSRPIPFDNGLYIDFTTNIQSVMVLWSALSD